MENRDVEIWKAFAGFEDYIALSSLGRVKRLKRRGLPELVLSIKEDGIFTVIIEGIKVTGTLRILIAKYFIPNPNNYKNVIHKNKILTDCRASNLQWSKCKQSEVSFSQRLGETHKTNRGCFFTIVEYIDANNCIIQFEDGTILKNIRYRTIKSGGIKNYNYPDNYGVGFIGYGKYSHKTHKIAYNIWRSVIQRCYSKRHQEKFPSYVGCSVTTNWHNFQNFAEWYEDNYKSHMEGWHLDKDFLIRGNRVYSPETCCILPLEINCLQLFPISKGKLATGVSQFNNMFVARIDRYGKKYHLGYFKTHLESAKAYTVAKEIYIKEIAEFWKDKIDNRIYHILINYKAEINESEFK